MHLDSSKTACRIREGVKIVVIGEANVGKSTFLNKICNQDVSIVTSMAGTTRDPIEASLDFEGYPAVITDTAGIRQSSQPVEIEGIKRTITKLEEADVVIFMKDLSRELVQRTIADTSSIYDISLALSDGKIVKLDDLLNDGQKLIIVANKADLIKTSERNWAVDYQLTENKTMGDRRVAYIEISCHTGQGMHRLNMELSATVKALCMTSLVQSGAISSWRHQSVIKDAVKELSHFLPFACVDVAVAGHKLRCALAHLQTIVGTVYTDDILDVIFKDFCIGK